MEPINLYILLTSLVSYVFLVMHGNLKGTWTDFGNHFTSMMVGIITGWLIWPLFVMAYLLELQNYRRNHRNP